MYVEVDGVSRKVNVQGVSNGMGYLNGRLGVMPTLDIIEVDRNGLPWANEAPLGNRCSPRRFIAVNEEAAE